MSARPTLLPLCNYCANLAQGGETNSTPSLDKPTARSLSFSLYPRFLLLLRVALKVRSLRIHSPCSCRSAFLRDGHLPEKPVPFQPPSTVSVESTAAVVDKAHTALEEGEKAGETVIEVIVRRESLSPS